MEKGEIAQNKQHRSFFDYGMVSKWCIREWIKELKELGLTGPKPWKQFGIAEKKKNWHLAFSHFLCFLSFNPLPGDKNLDWSKLKAIADNNLNVAKMIISLYDRVENIMGKGENAGYQHFLLLPQCFQKASFPEASKGVIVWE